MTTYTNSRPAQTVIIVGGGFSGLVCALQVRRLCPQTKVVVVERSLRRGPGLAYGEFAAGYVLNVPARRLDLGVSPSFQEWLGANASQYNLDDALVEAGGRMESVFAPRSAFGDYLEEIARRNDRSGDVAWIQAEAIGFLPAPRRGVVLTDGSQLEAAAVILATGNESPGPLGVAALENSRGFIANPWAAGALEGIARDADVALVGTGLTAVDVVLALRRGGHEGRITAISRRGLLPRVHRLCPPAELFIEAKAPGSPATLIRSIRSAVQQTTATGEPWQGVLDAIRPITQTIWQGWSQTEKRRFLRHARAWWDVHRHRMAPRVVKELADARLEVLASRIEGAYAEHQATVLQLVSRNRQKSLIRAVHVINCTGPTTDVDVRSTPIVADGLARGFLLRDPLGLGVESNACAAIGADGVASDWLFAIGPLTRPEFWEVTAVPEILAQGKALAERLSAADVTRGYGI